MQKSEILADYNEKSRNINIDIIKVLTVFFVISAHFLWHNNFYFTTISCPRMFVMATMRTFFMMTIGIFILTTGYLMHKKEFSKKYYTNIKRIIFPYILISIITFVAKICLVKYGIFEPDTIINHFYNFVDFRLNEYAWYVDMYLGLYLLIPFINKMLSNKMQDTILVITLLFLTALPSILEYPTLILSQWTHIWIITYYMIGAYIAKYDIKISLKLLIFLYITFFTIFATMNNINTQGQTWHIPGNGDAYGGYQNVITGVLFFLIILKTDFNKLPDKVKIFISNTAKLTLGIFLSSYIFDKIFYHYLNMYITNTTATLEWIVIIVPAVFVCSILFAKFIDIIYKYIDRKFLNFDKN